MTPESTSPVSVATIITPCLNAAHLLPRTVESVLNQTALKSGRLRVQYIVADGASTDETVDVIRELAGEFPTILSQQDSGMYDALANGFRHAEGDLVSYINAGDFYAPWALDVAADVFDSGKADWITGLAVAYNSRGQLIRARIPINYRSRLVRKGLYGSKFLPWFLQQESTFWRRSLLATVDLGRLASFRLAGDSYLWKCFAEVAEPVLVESYLGGFMYHHGQMSSDLDGYRAELTQLQSRLNGIDVLLGLFDRVGQWAPPRARKAMNPRGVLRYSVNADRWM